MALPPAIEPTFTVVSSSTRPSRIEQIARAAARIAERPSSGRMPACAATPRNLASMRKWLGEAVITSPIGEAWSNT